VNPFECPRNTRPCGQLHTGCIGHSKTSGAPCKGQVVNGTGGNPRCRMHLGTDTATVIAKWEAEQRAMALFRDAEAAAAKYRAEVGGGGADGFNPLEELIKLAEEILRWRDVCRQLLGEVDSVRYRARNGENVRGEVLLYTSALERAARVLTDLVKLNLEDRWARISEQQAGAVVAVLDGAMRTLGMDPKNAEVAAAIHEQLILVSKTADPDEVKP
jgi:hypothetical protein